MNDFYLYDLFTMNVMGMGEKKTEIYTKTKEKSPVWLPSHPPVYKNWRPTVLVCLTTAAVLLFLVVNTRRHEALWFWGGEGSGHAFNYIFYGEPS